MRIELRTIGFVRTDAEELPRHWSVSEVEGTLVIDEEYAEGLRDIEPGQRIVVIFNFHRSPGFSPEFLWQTPPHHGREMGVFSICSPIRPNPIGMSVVEVLGIRGANVDVKRLDMLDGHADTRYQALHWRQAQVTPFVSLLLLTSVRHRTDVPGAGQPELARAPRS